MTRDAISEAIEAVADKRHTRLCLHIPEHSAAACVAEWLGGLATEKQNAKRLSFILALKAGYEARI